MGSCWRIDEASRLETVAEFAEGLRAPLAALDEHLATDRLNPEILAKMRSHIQELHHAAENLIQLSRVANSSEPASERKIIVSELIAGLIPAIDAARRPGLTVSIQASSAPPAIW